MTAEKCQQFVISQNSNVDPANVKIAYPRKFNYYRIWIEVDENGIVVSSPGRG